MKPLLHLREIRKSFGTRRLLDIEELRIAHGQTYILTGMNGSGKSSLLRILAGLESASISSCHYDGQACALTPYPRQLRQEIVYVHQHPLMFSGSVAANIAYGLRLQAAPDCAARVLQAMDWAGVTHLQDQAASTLSGGEKQRVALARALVLRPRLLLLDEPTANLDGSAREQVIALLATLTTAGSSVVLVCHDRELIALPDVQRWKLRDAQLEMR